jgi:hypothetical protein
MNKGGTLCTMNDDFKQSKDIGLKLFLLTCFSLHLKNCFDFKILFLII